MLQAKKSSGEPTVKNPIDQLNNIISSHRSITLNPDKKTLIDSILDNDEAIALRCGALATWTPASATGRSPKDTYTVFSEATEHSVDWSSPFNNKMDQEVFDRLWSHALGKLENKNLFILNRSLGADSNYALPVRVVTDRAFSASFADNMFRSVPENINKSIFAEEEFTILALPYNSVPQEFSEALRTEDKKVAPLVIAIDYERRAGLILGTQYCGAIKKMIFTVMNYLLPEKGILPIHCSANEGKNGESALFLGLSGTGKTTISSDPLRTLIGDDEHGWSETGIANFENGCYAKLLHLDQNKEPEIYQAAFRNADVYEHEALIENLMVYPDGSWDVHDSRLTENARVAYKLSALENIKPEATGEHPKTIIFLTADANGVLPPVAKLSPNRAMLWFLMGYTSKLAGTEAGISEPVSTFSRFFGEPFMSRKPMDYMKLFGEKIEKHKTAVYLVNTGWTSGPFGTGHRFDINITRSVVNAALSGTLDSVEYEEDSLFHLSIPKSCPGVDDTLLRPKNTWKDRSAFDVQAEKLARQFAEEFEKSFGSAGISKEIAQECPGR